MALRVATASCVLWGGLSLGPVAGAASGAARSARLAEADEAAARAELQSLYGKARAAMDREDWPLAFSLMLDVWQRRRSADVAVNLGLIEIELGKWRDAAEHFAFGLSRFPPDADPVLVELNADRLAECQKRIVTLILDVQPVAATVYVAGRPLESRSVHPQQVFLEPGALEVRAELTDHESKSIRLNGQAGEQLRLSWVLHESVPAAVRPVTPARHSDPGFVWWPLAIGGGLGLLALGAGAGFHLDASAARSDADRLHQALQSDYGMSACARANPPACQELAELRDRQASSNRASNAALVSAGVFGVAGLAVQLANSRARWFGSTGSTMAPGLGLSGLSFSQQGLHVTGKF